MAKKELYDRDEDLDLLDTDTSKLAYTINDNLWDKVEKSVPRNTMNYVRFVQKYRDKNINKLETPYPFDAPIWSKECENIIYDTLGFSSNELYSFTSNIELQTNCL